MAKLLIKWTCIFLSLLIFTACADDEEDKTPKSEGIIVVEIATRGVYQYLIEVENQRYFPENLPERFKRPDNDNLEILLNFIVREQQKDIFRPSPNDIPTVAYSVPIIHILDIQEK